MTTLFSILPRLNAALGARANSADSLHALEPALDPVGLQAKVVTRKWMPIIAVCFSRVSSTWRIAAHRVLTACHGFYMNWIYTRSIATQMVGLKFFRHDLDENAVDDFMGVELGSIKVHAPVTSVVKVTCPNPTGNALKGYSRVDSDAAENRAQYFAVDDVMAILNLRGGAILLPLPHFSGEARLAAVACKGIAAFTASLSKSRIILNHLSLQLGFDGLGCNVAQTALCPLL